MSQQSRKLEGLLPEPNESVESFIERGRVVPAENVLGFRPQEGDSLGEYLLRLRVAAGRSPEDVETHLSGFPKNASLTRADLAKLESGYLELVTEQRLRLLATLYGVPQDWVLQTAQYPVDAEVASLPATDNAFSTMTMRSLQVDSLDTETRQALDQILSEIVSAVQSAQQEQPSSPSSTQE